MVIIRTSEEYAINQIVLTLNFVFDTQSSFGTFIDKLMFFCYETVLLNFTCIGVAPKYKKYTLNWVFFNVDQKHVIIIIRTIVILVLADIPSGVT